MNTENIDIKNIECFGFSMPKRDCWFDIIKKSPTKSWKKNDIDKIEKSLASNVDVCYYRMCNIIFNDIDTETEYFCSFNNGTKKWNLEISGSSAVAVDPKDVVDFFTSDIFKKYAKRFNDILTQALECYEKTIKQKLEDGELLKVNEIKAEAVEFLLKNDEARNNIKLGKYQRL